MRIKILFMGFILLLSMSMPVYALDGREAMYAELLISGDNNKVIAAARTIYSEKSRNIELLDVVAELLWRETKTRSYISSDGISWLVKVLSNTRLARYKDLLKDVEAQLTMLDKKNNSFDDDDDSSDSGFGDDTYNGDYGAARRRINAWLPKLNDTTYEKYVAGQLDFSAIEKMIDTAKKTEYLFKGGEYIHVLLLMSGERKQAVISAMSIYYAKSKNYHLVDVVAELLYRETQKKSYLSADDLSWLVKAVGNSRLTRYKSLLKAVDSNLAGLEKQYSVVDEYTDDEEDPVSESRFTDYARTRQYVARWLQNLRDTSYAEYIPGQVDLATLRGKLEKSKQAGILAQKDVNLARVKRRSNLYEATNLVGLPDTYSISIKGKHVNLVLNYGALGSLQFKFKRKRVGWYVNQVVVNLDKDYKEALLTNDAVELQHYARAIYHQENVDTELLDLVANRIWESKDTKDNTLGDAIAWLCKGIGKSKKSRYRDFMQEVAEQAENAKVKKYSGIQVKLLISGEEDMYLSYK